MQYPNIAPITEPTVHINAYLKERFTHPKQSAISRTSGGIGKKLDSANANIKRATAPQGVSAQCSTQS